MTTLAAFCIGYIAGAFTVFGALYLLFLAWNAKSNNSKKR